MTGWRRGPRVIFSSAFPLVFSVCCVPDELFEALTGIAILELVEDGEGFIPIAIHLADGIVDAAGLDHLPDDLLYFFGIPIMVLDEVDDLPARRTVDVIEGVDQREGQLFFL